MIELILWIQWKAENVFHNRAVSRNSKTIPRIRQHMTRVASQSIHFPQMLLCRQAHFCNPRLQQQVHNNRIFKFFMCVAISIVTLIIHMLSSFIRDDLSSRFLNKNTFTFKCGKYKRQHQNFVCSKQSNKMYKKFEQLSNNLQ